MNLLDLEGTLHAFLDDFWTLGQHCSHFLDLEGTLHECSDDFWTLDKL